MTEPFKIICGECGADLDYEIDSGSNALVVKICSCTIELEQDFNEAARRVEQLERKILNGCGSNLERVQTQYDLMFNEVE